jgi:hypothetical protein
MGKKPICRICGKDSATIRDRNEAPWGKRKKLCSSCHSRRLKHDLINITTKTMKEISDVI